MEQLSNANFQKFKDLSVFQNDQLIKLFLTIPKAKTLSILRSFEKEFRDKLLQDAPAHLAAQWGMSLNFEPETVGELMQPAPLILNENLTIEEVIK